MTNPHFVSLDPLPADALPDPSDPPSPPNRRERRKADTRRRLIDAARALFVARGYDATRPQDIARGADLAAGTFYVHFADKRAAFHAFTEQVAEELQDAIRVRVRGSESFQELLGLSLEALFEYSATNPGVLWATTADAAVSGANLPRGAGLRDRLADTLARGMASAMERGEVPRDFDAELIAHGVVGFIHHALVHGARDGLDRRQLLENLKRFLGRALRPEPEEPR